MSYDRQDKLQQLLARTQLVQGSSNRSRLKASFEDALSRLADADKAKASADYASKLIQGARDERLAKVLAGEKQAELNGLRVTTIDNFIAASSNAMSFFNTVNLAPDEQPWIENTTRDFIGVDYIGQDGKARKTQLNRSDEGFPINLHTLSTREVEYALRDIHTGDLKDHAWAQVDLADDLMRKIDTILWGHVKAQIGPFNLSGKRNKRVYALQPGVIAANLPQTNLLTVDAVGANTKWNLKCFQAVLEYVGAWGSNAFRDGELRAATVFIPSSDLFGWTSAMGVDTRENSLTKQIFETGYMVNFGGTSLTLVGDNTLDPDDGRAYVQFNKPIGEFFTKTSFDETFVDDTLDMRKQNKESISMNKVIGAGVPSTGRVNVAAVQYRNAK